MNRTLGFKDIVILAFSTMIGWGWVSLAGMWVVQGGVIGASVAFIAGALLCILVGLTYCELTPMYPYAGGGLVFSYKAMGYKASWFTGWMTTFAYVGVAAWEGPALATAIDYLIPVPRVGYLYTIAGFDVYLSWLAVPALVGLLLTIINLKGVSTSSKFQTLVTIVLAIGGVMFAGLAIIFGKVEHVKPLVTNTQGIFTVILAVPAMFAGFDVIPQAAEEMKVSLTKIPKAIIGSIVMAASWYIVIVCAAAFSAPKEILAKDGLTVVNAVNYSMNNCIAGKLIIITAIMGILSSWNGFILGATRIMYSMGKANMLPRIFGTVHSKYKTPYFAIIFIGLLTMITPLLGRNSLSWFVNASSFGTVIAYFMVALSFVVLRIKKPEVTRPFKVKNGMAIGILAIVIAALFIMLYLPVGASSLGKVEWAIVIAWLGLGILLYTVNTVVNSSHRDVHSVDIWKEQ